MELFHRYGDANHVSLCDFSQSDELLTGDRINRLDWRTYLIFMSTSAIFVPIVYFFYPETSNLSLEEIDSLFVKPGEYDSESAEEGQYTPPVKTETVHVEKL